MVDAGRTGSGRSSTSDCVNPLLIPFSILYGAAAVARQQYYRVVRPKTLGRPAVKVGNLTTGGTGKTPFVIYLAKLFQRRKLHPVVLLRGYGRTSKGVLEVSGTGSAMPVDQSGDEARMISDQFRGPVFVCEDRRAGAQAALLRYPEAVFILDDAYQQLGIQADLNLLLVDATDPFGNGHLLPAGSLREPVRGVSRADAIVVTRADHSFHQDELIETLKRYNRAAPLFFSYNEVVGLQNLSSGEWIEASELRGRSVLALSAIANPALFYAELAHQQIQVSAAVEHRDHHRYSQSDIDDAVRQADSRAGAPIVTTEKDAVKLRHLQLPAGRFFALGIEARVDEEENFVNYLKTFFEL